MHPGLLVFGLVIIVVVAVAGYAVRANEGRPPATRRRRDAGGAPFVGGDAGSADYGSSTWNGHSHGHGHGGGGHHSHHGDGGSFGGGG
ncbi:hypothetical protein [Quadrisphaera setariae]|uniref:Uncharacterized protein n=1 Tax=Quadrisphaera setariae TaxID=2593304 RepID=A0A5C8Z6D9_9ACTN|nr:hypothetical protein [Quadrisphaera setariae]TXR52711.1 hypothetical protein FMM08_18335 [Quadrisphaera setariae]